MIDWSTTLWDNAPFIALDTETTGVRKHDSICEISILMIENGEIVDRYYSLVNPRQPIPAEVTEIHHVTDDMVRDAPFIEDIASEINERLATGVPLVAHGLAFDARMLRYCPEIADAWPSGIPTLCTLDHARYRDAKTKTLGSFKLPDLTTMFGVYRDHRDMHRAEADTMALAALVPRLMRGKIVGSSMTKLSEAWIK